MWSPGWYRDQATRGTQYWDGKRWTGFRRPPRRPFAAAASHRGWGIFLIVMGALFFVSAPSMLFDPEGLENTSPVGAFFMALALGLIQVAGGMYLLRGRGPTTKHVLAQLEKQREQHQARQQQQRRQHLLNRFIPGTAEPVRQQVAQDCTECGAQVSGFAGDVIRCSYCDSAQQLPTSI